MAMANSSFFNCCCHFWGSAEEPQGVYTKLKSRYFVSSYYEVYNLHIKAFCKVCKHVSLYICIGEFISLKVCKLHKRCQFVEYKSCKFVHYNLCKLAAYTLRKFVKYNLCKCVNYKRCIFVNYKLCSFANTHKA